MNLKYWFRYYYRKLFKFKSYDNVLKEKGNRIMGSTIYSDGQYVKDYVKKQNLIHRWFKYFFLVPGIHFLHWLLGRYINDKLPRIQLYRNVRIYDKAFRNSLKQWNEQFRNRNASKNRLRKMLNSGACKTLMMFHKTLLTFLGNDTAYTEFFNMLMFNITLQMNRNYNSEHVKHVMYIGKSINDVRYFYATGDVPPQHAAIVDAILSDKVEILEAPLEKQKLDDRNVNR